MRQVIAFCGLPGEQRSPDRYYHELMPEEWFADTEPEALQVYLKLHREMTPEERLRRVFELSDFQQSLQIAGVRAMYPEAGDRELFYRVAARRLGRDIMIQAYGWDPDTSS